MRKNESVPKHLLLVDDDRLVLATLARGFTDAGYRISTAASAEEALDLLRTESPDLAMIDVRMPGMSGVELAHKLREQHPLPVVFLSAYGELDLVHDAAGAGAIGYLLKPMDVAHIIPVIETALVRGEEIKDLKETEQRLANALAIEQKTRMAVGVLMERKHLDRRTAFETLRNHARSQRRKIAEVAEELLTAVDTLNAPMPPGAKP